jgi:hypothetical protein
VSVFGQLKLQILSDWLQARTHKEGRDAAE